MTRIAIAVKTTEGGLWILPQIEEARRRGVGVTVITPPGQGRLVRAVSRIAGADSGVSHRAAAVHFSVRRPLATIKGLLLLRHTMRAIAPDAVLYHLYATALAVRLAMVGLPTRRVYMVAGPLYLDSRLIRFAERRLALVDDLIICGSEHIHDRYVALGVGESRLTTIPYGVDTSRFTPGDQADRSRIRMELGLDVDAFVAVMVAFVYAPKALVHRGEGIKGHRHLLQAWEIFQARHPAACLLLVGSGFDDAGEAYRQLLIDQVTSRAHSLAERGIRWLASVDDVRQAYNAADVSVSPSLSDNHGAALEASAMATPIIVSDAGALPEAVAMDSGWVFPTKSVDGLVQSLESAHQEWQSGVLQDRGRRARLLMVQQFDACSLAARVLDCVAP